MFLMQPSSITWSWWARQGLVTSLTWCARALENCRQVSTANCKQASRPNKPLCQCLLPLLGSGTSLYTEIGCFSYFCVENIHLLLCKRLVQLILKKYLKHVSSMWTEIRGEIPGNLFVKLLCSEITRYFIYLTFVFSETVG